MAWAIDVVGAMTAIVVVSFPPDRPKGHAQIPISVRGTEPNTWAGATHDPASIDHYYGEDLHADAVAVLHRAWQVQVFDPVWGRNDGLWSALRAAIGLARDLGDKDDST